MRRWCATLFQFASSAWELLELLGFQGEELLLALFARPTAPLREPEGWPPESFVFWDIYTMSWQKEDKVSKDNSKDLFQPAPCSHTSPLHGGLLRHHPLHLPLRITVPDPDKPWSSHRDPSLPDPASQCHRHPSPLLTLLSYLLSAGANPVQRHFQCSLRSVCFALPPPTVAPRVSGRVGGGGGCYCAVRRLLVGTWRRWKWQPPPSPHSPPPISPLLHHSRSRLFDWSRRNWNLEQPFLLFAFLIKFKVDHSFCYGRKSLLLYVPMFQMRYTWLFYTVSESPFQIQGGWHTKAGGGNTREATQEVNQKSRKHCSCKHM